MGLDITAYSAIKKVAEGDGWHVWDGGFERLGSVLTGSYYGADGCEEYGFRAGSYGGYSRWREWLSLAVHGCAPEDIWRGFEFGKVKGPFVEQIHFTDCDGSIGPEVAAKLAKDYADWQERIDALPDNENSGYMKAIYANFRRAFEIAANGGVVIFH